MSSSPTKKPSPQDESFDPVGGFSARRMTRKEKVLKEEIDRYHISDVDDTAVIYFAKKTLPINRCLDLPDAECDGLTYKQRVVSTNGGGCFLIARWVPDRYMRRTAPDCAQRWFVEKRLYPPDEERFYSRLEKRLGETEDGDDSAEN